jgi:hypothetical protein
MEKPHFICQRWFLVEKDEGKIERLLIVANEIEKHQFSYVLSKRAYHNVSDDHLLFSIFSRPSSVQFTSCSTMCLLFCFISMFLNIMYYHLSQSFLHAFCRNKTMMIIKKRMNISKSILNIFIQLMFVFDL